MNVTNQKAGFRIRYQKTLTLFYKKKVCKRFLGGNKGESVYCKTPVCMNECEFCEELQIHSRTSPSLVLSISSINLLANIRVRVGTERCGIGHALVVGELVSLDFGDRLQLFGVDLL